MAHTVGMTSGMADALGVAVTDPIAPMGLHEDVVTALTRLEGPAGRALAAVLLTEDHPAPVHQATGAPEVPTGAAVACSRAPGGAMALSAAAV